MGVVLILAVSPPSARAEAKLGAYAGSEVVDRDITLPQFSSAIGFEKLDYAHDFLAQDTWAAIDDASFWVTKWQGSTYDGQVVLSIPMLPKDVPTTLAQGASGLYNEHFASLARQLVQKGFGSATLRIGWEFNGSWFPWSIKVPNGAADYVSYWRRIVETMRGVTDADFKFDWSPNSASSNRYDGTKIKAEDAWPGTAYVDHIGLDIYDQTPASGTVEQRWQNHLTRPNGLQWHQTFASAKGKPMTFPEWGIVRRDDGLGGGDAPEFIQHMHDWIKTHNVAHHMYFQFVHDVGNQPPNSNSELFAGSTPQSDQRFRNLFGAPSILAAAAAPAVKAVAGDFDDDGKSDVALAGGSNWERVPVLASRGNGTFSVSNNINTVVADYAQAGGAKVVSGDFNADGKGDMAVMGPAGWQSVPVATSNGDGTFAVTNSAGGSNATLAAMAATPGVKLLSGDYNGDGRSDVALMGPAGWQSVPVATSNGDGTFSVTNSSGGGNQTLATMAKVSGVKAVSGDYNGDGRGDVALMGPAGWQSVPVATSNGGGTFSITNSSGEDNETVAALARSPGVKVVDGDFDGDGKGDLAFTGGVAWQSVPVAFSRGAGTFSVENQLIG